MNAKSLIGSLPIYAQHLAELTGVKVRVEGNQAFTDGKNVNVPFTEDDLPLTFGYIAHECSHVRNTVMECFEIAAPKPFRRSVLNILEDIRIENLSIEQYPGTESDLNYLVKKVLGKTLDPAAVEAKAPLSIVHDTLLLAGRWMVLKQDLAQPAQVMLAAQEKLLGKTLSEEIMQKVSGVLKCASTHEALELADAIIGMLPSEEEQQEDDQPQPDEGSEGAPEEQDSSEGGDQQQDEKQDGDEGGEGDGQDEADDSGNSDSSAGSAEGEGDENGQPDSEQKSSAGGQSDSSEQSQSQPGQGSDAGQPGEADQQADGKPSSKASNLRKQANEATEEDLKGLISEVGDAAGEMLGRKASRERIERPPFVLGGRSSNRSDTASARRAQLGIEQSSGLRQSLNGLLQAQVDCRVRLKRSGKRIDTGRIAMLKGGETRVFRSKARAERQSAAIQILLDKSGSMKDSMDQAEAAVYAVLHALEGISLVTSGAMSFPERKGAGEQQCSLIKSPNERLSRAVNTGGFGSMAEGGTPLAQALWPAAVEVLRAKGEKKILFVITDGEPSGGTAPAKEMIERCEASGIEVIALGFGSANDYILKNLFSQYRAVGEVSRLKNALFELVREALVA
ncbi:VWA domain-containing protein [Pseudomonas sp. 2FE]|uniref:VWA domain-containing protein n=1 Tax=Pseudomonas sp. 2FE TaxID=2502190 RepID=UPI0010F8A9B6|nr:VWA domain-containing protein [Pseudomonas sp. 2FE]